MHDAPRLLQADSSPLMQTFLTLYEQSLLPAWLKHQLILYGLGPWAQYVPGFPTPIYYMPLVPLDSAIDLLEHAELRDEDSATQQAVLTLSLAMLTHSEQTTLSQQLRQTLGVSWFVALINLLGSLRSVRTWLQTMRTQHQPIVPQLPRFRSFEKPLTNQHRLSVLHAVTAAFSGAITPQQLVDVALNQGFAAMGASAGALFELDEDQHHVRIVASIGYAPEVVNDYQNMTIADDLPVSNAMREQRNLFIRSREQNVYLQHMLNAHPTVAENVAWAVLLLHVEERVLGALGLSFSQPQTFTLSDRMFMETMADHCALALDRTHLFNALVRATTRTQIAHDQVAFLAEISQVLSSSLDYETTLVNLAEMSVQYLADLCVVFIRDALDQRLWRATALYGQPLPDGERWQQVSEAELYRGYGVHAVLSSGQPQLIAHVTDELIERIAHDDQNRSALQQLGLTSYMAVPIQVREQVIGVIAYGLMSERHYTQRDVDFALEVAHRAASAIDNARLYHQVRHSEQAHSEALAVLNALLASAPVGMAFWDHELRFVHLNQALAEMNSTPLEQHFGQHIQTILPHIPAEILGYLQHVLSHGEPVIDREISNVSRRNTQLVRFWLLNYYPVRNDHGEIIGVGGVINDITERKRAQAMTELLAEISKVLTASLDLPELLQSVADCLTPHVASNILISVFNEALEIEHTAYAPAAFTSSPDSARITSFLEHSLRDATWRSELIEQQQLRYSAPTPPLEASASQQLTLVTLAARGHLLGVLALLNEPGVPRLELDRSHLLHELAQRIALGIDNAILYTTSQQALNIREQFLSVASHELKTPMTSLMGYAQLLQRRIIKIPGTDERILRAVQAITNQTERLNRLVSSLLDLSRLQGGQLTIDPAPLDINKLVHMIVDNLESTLERHRIVADLPIAPIMIYGDELRMEQVIQNLLHNAIKYSDGGTITLRLWYDADQAHLSIQDEGVGIPADALPNLFRRFYRATNIDQTNVSGMGLGLYIVREIVHLHNASIEVSSTETVGSTFTLHIPRLQERLPNA